MSTSNATASENTPSFGASNLEAFAKVVQQAVNGKIVSICFHGVPDGEHRQVGLDPSRCSRQGGSFSSSVRDNGGWEWAAGCHSSDFSDAHE